MARLRISLAIFTIFIQLVAISGQNDTISGDSSEVVDIADILGIDNLKEYEDHSTIIEEETNSDYEETVTEVVETTEASTETPNEVGLNIRVTGSTISSETLYFVDFESAD